LPSDRFILDTGPLGRLARRIPRERDLFRLSSLLSANHEILVSEICDYEVRRSLVLHGLDDSLSRLDELGRELGYVPITTPVMRRAADLWAEARRRGRATADQHALDADVILAAQALEIGAAILTENTKHLSRYTRAVDWRTVTAA
jgi:predicted nucleic acid-binding protein